MQGDIRLHSADGGGLYIHVAYCRRKCIYCDFFSAGDRIADWRRYVDALCSELNYRKNEMAYPLRTIYIGGGTPSLMPSDEFVRLSEALKPYMDRVEEFTIEVNPDDVSEEKLMVWKSGGVNRISIGIQSLDDTLLSAIGRRHDATTAVCAYNLARQHFSNISVDMMFGLPGQTLEMWVRDLRKIISMRPEHISAYSLMYEEGTAMTSLRNSGRLDEAPEELSEQMFGVLVKELRDAGFQHYEISNFAMSGFRSRHNSSYWRQSPYLGLGPSAHSYDGMRSRKSNRADLRGYLDCWSPSSFDSCITPPTGIERVVDEEILTDDELREEYIMTRMRTCEGIDLLDFRNRFGVQECSKLLDRSKERINIGSIVVSDNHLALSERAILMSDGIILDLF